MIRTQHLHCHGPGSIPGQGTEILQVVYLIYNCAYIYIYIYIYIYTQYIYVCVCVCVCIHTQFILVNHIPIKLKRKKSDGGLQNEKKISQVMQFD